MNRRIATVREAVARLSDGQLKTPYPPGWVGTTRCCRTRQGDARTPSRRMASWAWGLGSGGLFGSRAFRSLAKPGPRAEEEARSISTLSLGYMEAPRRYILVRPEAHKTPSSSGGRFGTGALKRRIESRADIRETHIDASEANGRMNWRGPWATPYYYSIYSFNSVPAYQSLLWQT